MSVHQTIIKQEVIRSQEKGEKTKTMRNLFDYLDYLKGEMLAKLDYKIGYVVLCDVCDEDDLFLLRKNAIKFYKKHGSRHRHPASPFHKRAS